MPYPVDHIIAQARVRITHVVRWCAWRVYWTDMTSNIKQLSSPSHPISFEFGDEPTQATVTLGDTTKTQAQDLVVLTKLAKPHEYAHIPPKFPTTTRYRYRNRAQPC